MTENRPPVQLIVGGDNNAVDVLDRQAGVGQCLLNGVVCHFLIASYTDGDGGPDRATGHTGLGFIRHRSIPHFLFL